MSVLSSLCLALLLAFVSCEEKETAVETKQEAQQTNYPSYQPKYPTLQPYYPTYQPYYPTYQPYYPTYQPYYPTYQPYYPTYQPYYPTYQPYYPTQSPSYQPYYPTYQPWYPTSYPTYQPWYPTSYPTYQPWYPTSYPTYQPWYPTEAPTDSSGCGQFPACGPCTSSTWPKCDWCLETKTCFRKNATGCSNVVKRPQFCPKDPCTVKTNCTDCTQFNLGCGWCLGMPVCTMDPRTVCGDDGYVTDSRYCHMKKRAPQLRQDSAKTAVQEDAVKQQVHEEIAQENAKRDD